MVVASLLASPARHHSGKSSLRATGNTHGHGDYRLQILIW
jgi:hypothetical protein